MPGAETLRDSAVLIELLKVQSQGRNQARTCRWVWGLYLGMCQEQSTKGKMFAAVCAHGCPVVCLPFPLPSLAAKVSSSCFWLPWTFARESHVWDAQCPKKSHASAVLATAPRCYPNPKFKEAVGAAWQDAKAAGRTQILGDEKSTKLELITKVVDGQVVTSQGPGKAATTGKWKPGKTQSSGHVVRHQHPLRTASCQVGIGYILFR